MFDNCEKPDIIETKWFAATDATHHKLTEWPKDLKKLGKGTLEKMNLEFAWKT